MSSERIAELLLDEHLEPEEGYENNRIELSEELQSELPGRYINEDRNNVFELKVDDGKLLIGEDTEMIPVGDGVFRINGGTNLYEIMRGVNDDRLVTISVSGSDGNRNFTKADAWQPDTSDLNQFSGEYLSDEIDSIMRFSVNDEDTLEVHHRWMGTTPLEPLTDDIFRAGNGMMIEFEKDESGNVTGFYANSGRTLDVWFGLQ